MHEHPLGNNGIPAARPKDDGIGLLDLLIGVGRHKKILIGTPLVTGTVALAISLLMTPMFTSTVTIMPPQQQQSSLSAIMGQLGGLASMAGGIAGVKSPADIYVGILESRTVADNLISRFDLKTRYKKETLEETRKELATLRSFNGGKKDGMIAISATDEEPKFAAQLANAYVEELEKLNQTLALSEASQRRLFFEKQLNATKDQLADAEIALRTTQEKTGMIKPDAQVQAIITNAAQLKGTIAAKEVQLRSMRSFATNKNPEVIRAQEELSGLQSQLGKLEKDQKSNDGDFMVATSRIPGVGVEYVRSVRNVKYYETIFELLSKQFELAKIDEARDSNTLQVLDRAIPAERKSKPQRTLIVLAGLISGVLIGILWAYLSESYQRSSRNPENELRWKQLGAVWKKKPHNIGT